MLLEIGSNSSTIFCMTEHEKAQQIGELAEQYSHVRGQLNHVTEKLAKAQIAAQLLGNQQVFQSLRVEKGALLFNNSNNYQPQPRPSLDGLVGHTELIKIVEEKQRLTAELQGLAERLRALAPHLL